MRRGRALTDEPEIRAQAITSHDVAKGAGTTLLARLGAVVEVVAQPVYVWLFGLASFGRAMGLMGPIITLCVMPGFAIIGRMYDELGTYSNSLVLFACVCCVAAIILKPLRIPED